MPSAALAPLYAYRPPSGEDIFAMYQARRAAQGVDTQRIRDIQAVMNNDWAVPLPEILSTDERVMIANLAERGNRQMAARVGSIDPVCYWPSLRPGFKAADDDADKRRLITSSWHYENDMRLLRVQRGMRLLAYASCPVVIKPYQDRTTGDQMPKWYNKHPLDVFPSETEFNDYLPSNVIITQRHTYGWLREKFPQQVGRIKKPFNFSNDPMDDNSEITFDVLEYLDDRYGCLVLIAPDTVQEYGYDHASYGSDAELLHEYDNFAMAPLCVTPGSISLDKTQGEYDGIIGMYQAQATLMTMSLIGQRRAIWPREWAISNPNETVKIVSIPDPASGTPGKMTGGTLTTQQLDPSFRAEQLQDRIEHNIRQGASLPSEFGGMSQSDNVRTGRRGAQVMGAAIDFTIAQAQDILAKSLRHENEVAIAVDKAFFNYRNKKYFVMTEAWQGTVTYTPSDLWVSTKHIAKYPINGVDADQLPVVGGQRISMNTMSRRRFMEIDPLIPDADAEDQQIIMEAVRVAFLSSIQQLAANPEGPWQPIHIARFQQKLATGKDLYQAMIELQKEIQEEQAQVAPDPAAAQPGMSLPGQGVEQPSSIPEQGPSAQHFAQLLSSLGKTEAAQGRAQRR